MQHVIPVSGKDSLMTALVCSAHWPEHDYRYVFNDVRAELPETYAWLNKVETAMGWEIERVGESLPQMIQGGGILPSHRMRFCTDKCKIRPLKRLLKAGDATVYYGLRADEPDRQGYQEDRTSGPVILPRYPLRELGIGLALVYQTLEVKDLLPPTFFWQRLHDAVDVQLSWIGDWRSKLTQHEFNVLFAGRSRSNCFFCFFMRKYEWVWLAETHPDLFEQAVELEASCGADGYTWQQGESLTQLLSRQEMVFQRRVSEVAKLIRDRCQGKLFADDADTVMGATSCGLFCGK
jgi:hypothetical protein